MANENSVIDDLLSVLSPEEQTAVKAKLAANPRIIAQDKFVHSLFGAYKGLEDGTGTGEPVTPPAAVHTPTVPSAAAPVIPPVAAAPPAAAPGSDAVLKALSEMKTSLDERLKNVVTTDQLPKLGNDFINSAVARALKQTDELATIRETHREEFGTKLDTTEFEKFVNDSQDATTKLYKYSTLTDAYNAMVGEKRIAKKIADGVAEGVKLKTSSTTVPGQTQSTGVSPAQQVIAKAKADSAGGGKTNLQAAIDKARLLDQGSTAVQ